MFIYILYERSLKKDALKRMPFIISAWTFSCQWLNTKIKQNKTKHQTKTKNGQEKQLNVILPTMLTGKNKRRKLMVALRL